MPMTLAYLRVYLGLPTYVLCYARITIRLHGRYLLDNNRHTPVGSDEKRADEIWRQEATRESVVVQSAAPTIHKDDSPAIVVVGLVQLICAAPPTTSPGINEGIQQRRASILIARLPMSADSGER
jgi:hypothetical protein